MDLGDCVCRMERGATLVNDQMGIVLFYLMSILNVVLLSNKKFYVVV